MKCFLIVNERENKIVKVHDDDIVSFELLYAGKILLEGDSVQDLIMKLSATFNGDRAGEFETALHR